MLFEVLFATVLYEAVNGEAIDKKTSQITLALPIDFPNRNDRADQCWLRIEDVELTETVNVYCHIAQAFLGYYIHDYNNRKIAEDGVNVSLWVEKPVGEKDAAYGPPDVKGIKNWSLTTVMDPTTKRRLYVSKDAVCRMIMYSREGMSNYVVDCETVLYFINEHLNGAKLSRGNILITILCMFLVNIV